MCDPLTLLVIGAGMTAGGYGAKTIAQGQVDSARANAINAENARQRAFDQELYGVTRRSQDRYTDAEAKRGDTAATIEDMYRRVSSDATSGPALAATDSNITNVEREKQGSKARRFSQQQARAQANVRSFGDFLGGAGRGVQRDTGEAGTIAGFKRGSSAVLPLELDGANRAGGTMRLFGDILGALGSVGMSAGLSGGMAGPGSVTRGVRAGATPATRVGGFGRLAGPI